MSCPNCGCRDGRTISTHEGTFRGQRIARARRQCRNCGRSYSVQLPNEDEDHDEDGLPPEDLPETVPRETRRNRDPDNPYLV